MWEFIEISVIVIIISTLIWSSFSQNYIKMKNWALWVWEQPTDFLIGNTENLPKLELQDDKRYEYNQGSSNDCTIFFFVWFAFRFNELWVFSTRDYRDERAIIFKR